MGRRPRLLLHSLVAAALLLVGFAAPAHARAAAAITGGGSGSFSADAPVFAGDRVQLEVTARESGSGRFNAIHLLASGGVFTRIEGVIDCLAVAGDVAIATGVVTAGVAGTGVDPVGSRVSFTIVDGNPDVFAVDLAFFSGHTIAPCTSDPILSWSVEHGNFQIRA